MEVGFGGGGGGEESKSPRESHSLLLWNPDCSSLPQNLLDAGFGALPQWPEAWAPEMLEELSSKPCWWGGVGGGRGIPWLPPFVCSETVKLGLAASSSVTAFRS